jgi:hypothetical protein
MMIELADDLPLNNQGQEVEETSLSTQRKILLQTRHKLLTTKDDDKTKQT